MDVEEAKKDQLSLRGRLRVEARDLSVIRSALAIGVSYSTPNSLAICVGVPCYLDCTPIGETYFSAEENVDFPYMPGLFAYREGPAVSKLLNSIDYKPEMLLFDSQGIAHPRGFGLACHLGVLHDLPSLGATRRRLFGKPTGCAVEDGAVGALVSNNGNTIGFEYRPLKHCTSFFVSHGHLTDNETLLQWLKILRHFRGCFPVAIERAHNLANKRAFNN